jgi:hypothetical protein
MAHKGFTDLEDLGGVLETDNDVTKMAKRMVSRTQAEGRVLLGTVVIKQLKMLIWWIRDRQKRGLVLYTDGFPAAAMNEFRDQQQKRGLALDAAGLTAAL